MLTDLIFLHGFMGESRDWDQVTSLLEKKFNCHCPDLPHRDIFSYIIEYANDLKLDRCALVGYSMGGRLSMMLKNRCPERFETAVIISAHLGLQSESEKSARWKKDLEWVSMLENRPFEEFLEAWYSQSYFTNLRARPEIYYPMLERRRRQDPKELADVMKTYSLSKQSRMYAPDCLYMCGSQDLTYVNLYHTLPPSCQVRVVPDSGHNIVLENPDACAAEIKTYLEETNARHRLEALR